MDDQGVTFSSRIYRRGWEDGLRDSLLPLSRQCERKLGRAPTEPEFEVIRSRATCDPVCVGDALLDLDSAALAAWIAAPDVI